MKTTSTYGATLLDVMGSDLTVVNAARVSFDKESDWENDTWGHPNFEEPSYLSDKDTKLINYLAREGHWSPLSHPQLSFRVSAPLFVARQLQKHQVGLAWNEVSRRYVDSEPTFYSPKVWRKKADNVKQGSSDDEVYLYDMTIRDGCGCYSDFDVDTDDLTGLCLKMYESLLSQGVCPEQARMVLPQSLMTTWVWTGSLYAFARVVKQRLDPHAQRECRPVAEDIAKALEENFPVSWQALQQS